MSTTEKREHHLTLLSGELAVFSLFDTRLYTEERQEIATKLHSLMEQWEPREMLIDSMTVPHPHFCTSDTFWPVSPSGLQLELPYCHLYHHQIFPALGGKINCLNDTLQNQHLNCT